MTDSRLRFSDRVDNYEKFRPGYPNEAVDFILRDCGPGPAVVADVGSGTGLFTQAVLDRGLTCWAVEPNREMRLAAENRLSQRPGFHSQAGEAAATGLATASCDLVVCATAFHWFARPETVAEFRRLLKPNRGVSLVWNVRADEASEFSQGYEALLRQFVPGYEKVMERSAIKDDLPALFADWQLTRATVPHSQWFDLPSLQGRLESSSYCPQPEAPEFSPLMAGLAWLWMQHQRDGRVELPYRTEIYSYLPKISLQAAR